MVVAVYMEKVVTVVAMVLEVERAGRLFHLVPENHPPNVFQAKPFICVPSVIAAPKLTPPTNMLVRASTGALILLLRLPCIRLLGNLWCGWMMLQLQLHMMLGTSLLQIASQVFDVEMTFLYGKLKEEIFMRVSEGYRKCLYNFNEDKVLELLMAI